MITEGKSSGPVWSVFAVDPGETSGWAWACVSRAELVLGVPEALTRARRAQVRGPGGLHSRFMCGQVGSRWDVGEYLNVEHAHVSELTAMLEVCSQMTRESIAVTGGKSASRLTRRVSDVTIEDFILREGTKDRSLLSPVRLTFGLEHELAMLPDLYTVTKFQPSQAKSTANDERLKRWNLWTPGQQHARDATRHLVLWLKELCQQEGIHA